MPEDKKVINTIQIINNFYKGTLGRFLSIKSNNNNFFHIFSDRKSLKQLFEISKAYENPNSRFLIRITIMNTIAVLYTLFALPLYVAYDTPIDATIVFLEILISLLFALNTYLKIRSFVNKAKKAQNKKNILFELFLKTDILFDLFASLPSFLVFSKNLK